MKTINPSTTVLSVATDISSESDVKYLYDEVQKKFGRPADVLLNNAGYLHDDQLVGDGPTGEWLMTIVSSRSI
jgi:NAD(P)-dependent dehydrogenase (short-subunit alcohol dehydrogenase family)